jgi:hypothetical protein
MLIDEKTYGTGRGIPVVKDAMKNKILELLKMTCTA